MDSHLPLVSIVITSYNREKWITQAITSAIEQDYPNLEIVINDDGSTDNTDEVVKQFLHDSRIRYSKNEKNLGIALNFHRSFIELAKGKYMISLGSDDYLENPSFISNAMRYAGEYENIGLIFGKSSMYFEDTGKIVPYDKEKEELLFRNLFNKGMDVFFLPPSISRGWAGCIVNAEIMRKFNIGFSDIVLCDDARINFLMMTCSDVLTINEPCYMNRNHPENLGKVRPAELIIHDVLHMLEDVTTIASQRHPELENRITQWKHDNLVHHILYNMNYLASDKTEFRKFSKYVKQHYPEIYKTATGSRNFFYIKYIYPNITIPLKKILGK